MRIVLLSLLTAASLLLPAQISMAQSPPHTEGQCGGSMRGYDGREYPCGPIRKPACDQNNSRCVCLEKVECGGRTNEPF